MFVTLSRLAQRTRNVSARNDIFLDDVLLKYTTTFDVTV